MQRNEASLPLVSVCMITWNHARYISAAIAGVLAQHAPFNIELIVGDDCSTDGASAIIDRLAALHPDLIRVVRGEANIGMHANAATCVRSARGKYIAICEGDDCWHDPFKLRDQVALLESDSTLTLCHSDFDRLTRLRRQRARHRHASPPPPIGDAYEALLTHWNVMSATAVYRADILHQFAGSPLDNWAWPFGDYNRLLFAATQGTFAYLPRSTATYRKVAGSAGNKGAEGDLRIQQANKQCIEAFICEWPPSDVGAAQARAEAERRIYRAAFWTGRAEIMRAAAERLAELTSPMDSYRNRVYLWVASKKRLLYPIRAARDLITQKLSSLPR